MLRSLIYNASQKKEMEVGAVDTWEDQISNDRDVSVILNDWFEDK